ncbi:hypothetical protein FOVSG1_006121 [Fusarium oxysporum f. sp. vasinfectum]
MSDNAVHSQLKLFIGVHARVLICSHDTCRVALSPSPAQVSEHLRKKHNIAAAERCLVTDLLKTRISPLQSPSEAPIRQDGSAVDPNLHLVHGFTCKFYTERTGSSQLMSRHITLAHEKQRLQLGVRRKAMYEPVFLQVWTKSPSGGRYRIVEYRGVLARPIGGKDAYDHLQGVFERERRLQQGSSAGQAAVGRDRGSDASAKMPTPTFTDLRPWLERTGWEQTYKSFDRDLLQNLTIVPSASSSCRGLVLGGGARSRITHTLLGEDLISSADDERKIAAILVAVDRVMDRCEQTAQTTSRGLLCWLPSVRPHGCYARPFTFVSKAASRTKYIRLLKRFVVTVFRAYCLPTNICRRSVGIRFKR